MKQFQVIIYVLILILVTSSSTKAIDYAKKGCNDTCGFVSIPYPFGIGEKCSANKWYVVDCISSKPYLSAFNNIEMLGVNLEEHTVIVNVSVASHCRDSVGDTNGIIIPSIDLGKSPFVFSASHNKLTVEGCGYGEFLDKEDVLASWAITCDDSESSINQLAISNNLKSYSVNVTFLKVSEDGVCGSVILGITPMVFDSIWRDGMELKRRNASYYPQALKWFVTNDEVDNVPNCWETREASLGLGNSQLRKCSCGEGRVGNPYLLNQCTESTEPLSLAKKGCNEKCGDVRIPFPFGIGEHCALDERYVIHCNSSIPYLSAFNNTEVLNVSLEQQTITVNVPMNFDSCQNNHVLNSNQILLSTIHNTISNINSFKFSKFHNIFVVLGCGNAVITGTEGVTITGCSTICNNDTFIDLNNCYGFGCCQATVPYHIDWFNLNLTQLESQGKDGTCGLALLVDKDSFFNGRFSLQPRDHFSAPISLLWPLDQLTDEKIQYFANRPECTYLAIHMYDRSLMGYRKCQCNISQEGNPYLPNGCRKHEKCRDCERRGGVCSGSFRSVYEDVTSPIISEPSCDIHNLNYDDKSSLGVILGVSISLGLVFLTTSMYALYKIIKKTIAKRRKQKFFRRNGGLLLKQQEATDGGLVDRTILFTSKELEVATDHYNENRILGRGGQGTVYKGMLVDGRIVAVKKSKIVDESQLDQFINEVLILSQVNHRNVVKLLGCCLETEVPQLVSEFVPNGTLYDFIQDDTGEISFSLNMRLQIATEVAGALSYLHSATSIPIYHRDIKTTNILLDEKYRAKVSDFGTSRFVSIDQTHFTTLVKGTFGYLDPEYFQSSQFTEKSDVYSFGVVLLEIFTREKPIFFAGSDEHRNLATHFMVSMEEGCVMSIFDPKVVNEDSKGVILAIANLAMRCLNAIGKYRPTMKEVAIELEGIRMSHVPSTVHASFGHANHSEDLLMSTYDDLTSTSFTDTFS
ncbi:hypothetical protein QVD17_37350 [Tagetes erecta]|uniref:Protein kinase domain-containing protein n=1 Tax=Tagetes erecta TaxID=13708 RepID=A0AAD8JTW5_TARER|nr:hypothetical protein QVD17_37350 [Tagetes erecta]